MPNQRSKQKTITNFFTTRPVKVRLAALARLLGKTQTEVLVELIDKTFSQYGEEITKPIVQAIAREQQADAQGKGRPGASKGRKPTG